MIEIENKIINLQFNLFKICGYFLVSIHLLIASVYFVFSITELFYFTIIKLLIIVQIQYAAKHIFKKTNFDFKIIGKNLCNIYIVISALTVAYEYEIERFITVCYFPLFLLLFLFYKIKKVITISLFTIALTLFLILAIKLFGIPVPVIKPQHLLFYKIYNPIFILSFSVLFYFILYHYIAITTNTNILKNKNNASFNIKKNQNKLKTISILKSDNNTHLELLFKKIERHMDEKKPWLNPKYSIKNLSREVFSNTLYVSRCINLNEKKSFKNYINTYRLNYMMQCKSKIDEHDDTFSEFGFPNKYAFKNTIKNNNKSC